MPEKYVVRIGTPSRRDWCHWNEPRWRQAAARPSFAWLCHAHREEARQAVAGQWASAGGSSGRGGRIRRLRRSGKAERRQQRWAAVWLSSRVHAEKERSRETAASSRRRRWLEPRGWPATSEALHAGVVGGRRGRRASWSACVAVHAKKMNMVALVSRRGLCH